MFDGDGALNAVAELVINSANIHDFHFHAGFFFSMNRQTFCGWDEIGVGDNQIIGGLIRGVKVFIQEKAGFIRMADEIKNGEKAGGGLAS